MAAQPADAPGRAPAASSGASGNFLTRKLGPLPMWAWGLLGGITVYAGYRYYESKKSASSSTAATEAQDQSQEAQQGYDYGPSYAATQSEIQNLQGAQSTEASGLSSLQSQQTSTAAGLKKESGFVRSLGSNVRALQKAEKKPAAKKKAPARKPAAKTTKPPAKAPAKPPAKKATPVRKNDTARRGK
jgi:hypothetical protein